MEDKNKFQIGLLGVIIGLIIGVLTIVVVDKLQFQPKVKLYRAINLEHNTIAIIKSNIINDNNAYMSGNMVFVDDNDTISNQDPDCMMYTILEPIN